MPHRRNQKGSAGGRIAERTARPAATTTTTRHAAAATAAASLAVICAVAIAATTSTSSGPEATGAATARNATPAFAKVAGQDTPAAEKPNRRGCLNPADYFETFGKWAPRKGDRVNVCIHGEADLKVTGLSDTPTVYHIEGLVKPHEVAAIAGKTAPLLKPSQLGRTDPTKDMVEENDWRRSKMITLSAANGIRAMNSRISQLLKIPMPLVLNSTMQVQRYGDGDRYFPHFDSRRLGQLRDTISHRGSGPESYPFSGRVLTVVIYLDTVDSGHTIFPLAGMAGNYSRDEAFVGSDQGLSPASIGKVKSGVRFWRDYCRAIPEGSVAVAPRRGDAIVFFNHEVVEGRRGGARLGELDPFSFHGGCVVGEGQTKTMANYWVQVHPHHFADEEESPRIQEAEVDVEEFAERVMSPR